MCSLSVIYYRQNRLELNYFFQILFQNYKCKSKYFMTYLCHFVLCYVATFLQYYGTNLNCCVLLRDMSVYSGVLLEKLMVTQLVMNDMHCTKSQTSVPSCSFIRHLFHRKWYRQPVVFLIDICFRYQSKHNTLHTLHSMSSTACFGRRQV
jgi:hypothetical protein